MAQAKRFLSLDDLTHQPKPAWLVEGLFEANSLVMLAGPPASYKSFLALDWLLCMATGRSWQGRQTVPARVLYVLGEGKASLLKRIETWLHYYNVPPEEQVLLANNFRVTFDVPQMAVKSSVDNMLAGLEAENYQPNVLVVDTFARSFVGLDENSQKDVGLWVDSADRLRSLGLTVIFLHHTKKNTEYGLQYRGSSAIMGAMDTAMTLARDGSDARVVLNVTKQKDHDEGNPIYFQRLVVCPDAHEEGSCILVPTVKVDERFTEDFQRSEELVKKLIADQSYDSDWARARVLADQLKITDTAAQSRISRLKKDLRQKSEAAPVVPQNYASLQLISTQ